VATIDPGEVWGVTYYGIGHSSDEVLAHPHFFTELMYVTGNVKLAISGPNNEDYWEFQGEDQLMEGNPGDPNGEVIFLPGPYMFDLSSWPGVDPGEHTEVYVQIVTEGDMENAGFAINRVRIQDDYTDTPWDTIPEPGTVAFLSMGLGSMMYIRKRRRRFRGTAT